MVFNIYYSYVKLEVFNFYFIVGKIGLEWGGSLFYVIYLVYGRVGFIFSFLGF